ncbi:MAG: hypothetical protein L3J33_01485 [Rhodobacteraceae bacterium]|nr:hypothetical protein [Paracoccaceae bacterium]
MFEYRLLPTPAASKKVKGLKTVPERFAHALTEALNTEAKNGWEFVGQESFSVEDKPGMMKKSVTTELTYLVFKRSIETDAVPLDQKLENLRNQRARTVVQAVAPATAAAVLPVIPSEPEPTAITEPFPEPMPTYVPEEPQGEPFMDEPETDPSRSLPFPGPSPAPTIGMAGSGDTQHQAGEKQTLNYDHSSGPSKGASVDAPILGPARRD